MKNGKLLFVFILTLSLSSIPYQRAEAVIPIAKIIKEGIKKVIKAVDLMVQRLQNKTIWLQNAQKVLENKLSDLKLKEIAEWTDKHRKLYKEYYDELWKVKNTINSYQRIKQILQRQVKLVNEYKRVWALVQYDEHFTKQELAYMYRVYTGILDESIRNLDLINLAINSMKLQIPDAARLEIISRCGDAIERNYSDLREFNAQNIRLSLNRAKDKQEVEVIKKLYGISN